MSRICFRQKNALFEWKCHILRLPLYRAQNCKTFTGSFLKRFIQTEANGTERHQREKECQCMFPVIQRDNSYLNPSFFLRKPAKFVCEMFGSSCIGESRLTQRTINKTVKSCHMFDMDIFQMQAQACFR